MKRAILVSLLVAGLFPAEGSAKQVTLRPVTSVRVVNPRDADDVRVFYKFDLPEGVQGADIVFATLHISSDAENEMPLMVGAVESAWSSADSWSSLASNLSNDSGYQARVEECLMVSNHLDGSGELTFDAGIEVTISSLVSLWAAGGENYGVCVRGVSGRSDDLSEVLTPTLETPELTILYTSR